MKKNKFWVVGASFSGTEDVSQEFLKKAIWYDGWAEDGDHRDDEILEEINIGDILLMKSSSTKGKNHSMTFTKLKGIGEVLEKIKPHYFNMKWFDNPDLPMDFDEISYRKTIEPLRDDDIYDFVKQIFEMENIKEIIKLLEYKSQIILQGPPGTGKTRMAKIMAKEITKAQNLGNPILKIDEFFRTFNPDDSSVVEKREKDSKLLSEFLSHFPKDKLSELTLESYSIGTGSNDSFCWWMEAGLRPLGYYFPGSSRAYLIYWNKVQNNYLSHYKHSKYLTESSSPEEAMKKIALLIHNMVVNKDLSEVLQIFGDSFILKILHTYYPEDYFPINSNKCLENVLKLLNIVYSEMDFLNKNKTVQEFFVKQKKKYNVDVSNIDFMRFLFDNFDLKGKISIQSDGVILEGESKIIQFHHAYSYEDFVRGITANTFNGNIFYEVENKVLAEFAQKALDNPSANYVLVIDEINRANLPSVLGELIYALEYRYDEEKPDETTVESIYALKVNKEDETGDKVLKLPKNLYIIGTMNTADRSVGHIDYAIRRRFAFIEMLPNPAPIKEFAKEKFKMVSSLFIKNYDSITDWQNPILEKSDHLAPDFRPEDVWIGHSYFITKADNDEGKKELDLKIKYEVLPILKEYIKDGILNESANSIINELPKN
jgi:5-methylcytosine-specific restriction enzyme B